MNISILRWLALSFGIVMFSASLSFSATLSKIGPGEGEVGIVAWAGYIERGDTDKNFDWVTDFEKETGCKVKVKTAATSDEMVALMNAGGFDLVTASGDASLRLIAGKQVQEINTGLIKLWGKLDKRLQNAKWHTINGKHYEYLICGGPMYSCTTKMLSMETLQPVGMLFLKK